MSTSSTPTQRLATVILGQSVESWIGSRRAEGESWRAIAKALKHATNGEIDLSHEILRRWAENGGAAA